MTAITRGTHLARLAGGWAGCAGCPHAADTAGLSRAAAGRVARRFTPPDPFHEADLWAGGVAGRDATPAALARLAVAFAAVMRHGAADEPDPETRPVAVVGTDERPASRHLAPAVVSGLTRAGWDVRMIGVETDAAVRFAVRHHGGDSGAACGLHVAAPGRPGTHAGLVPVTPGGGLPTPGDWSDWRAEWERTPPPPPARVPGTVTPSDAPTVYERSLWPLFRTLSARRVTVAGAAGPLAARLTRLFAALPDELRLTDEPPGRESEGDIVLALSPDSRRFDLPAGVRDSLLLAAGGPIGLPRAEADRLRLRAATAGVRVTEIPDHPAAAWAAVEAGAAAAVTSAGPIIWRTPAGPTADPIRTLAALLRRAATNET